MFQCFGDLMTSLSEMNKFFVATCKLAVGTQQKNHNVNIKPPFIRHAEKGPDVVYEKWKTTLLVNLVIEVFTSLASVQQYHS